MSTCTGGLYSFCKHVPLPLFPRPLWLTAPRLLCSQADTERRRAAGFQEDLKNLKEQHFQIQKQVEQEEEYITNKLTKRLNQLKKEKQTLANEVEQEEEFLVRSAIVWHSLWQPVFTS